MCISVSLNRILYWGRWIEKKKYKGGSELRCSLLKKCCRWNMSFKIVEQNVGLDARNDIDKDVRNKWVWNCPLEKDVNGDFLSDYVRNCQISVIKYILPGKMNGNLFVFNCIDIRSKLLWMPHSILLSEMNLEVWNSKFHNSSLVACLLM